MSPQTDTAPAAGATIAPKRMADAIRVLAMDAVEAAKAGHPGMPMGMADAATALFSTALRFDPHAPDWPDRDRFVLSAGHGSMLLYAILHLTGYASAPLDALKRFRQLGSPAAGHPERELMAGVETTTGPLGQGLGNAVGMAIAEAHLRDRFGAALVDHRTFVIASDGDLQEGISHESAALAGHLNLDRLVVLWDDNEISIDGPTSLSDSVDHLARFDAYGWATRRVDGHDHDAVADALAWAQAADQPALIACRTRIGYGAPTKEGSESSHGAPLGPDEVAGAREALGWPHPPFEIPEDVRAAWTAVGARGGAARAGWDERFAAAPAEVRAEFSRRLSGVAPRAALEAARQAKAAMAADPKPRATRSASGETLKAVTPAAPELIAGSADLTGSNNVRTPDLGVFTAVDRSGRFLHYGVREHAMAAAMNGMALHGGVRPYAGTFLVFGDYMRPAVRMAALMGQPSVFVMTHDSIGVGEDGPTHQPVEHLAAFRAMPNLTVIRPGDAVETAEAWEIALGRTDGPTLLALTRQKLPPLRAPGDDGGENRAARGGYVLTPGGPGERIALVATGSEVAIAVEARALLQDQGVAARVVSLPSFELFAAQPEAYRKTVLPPDMPCVAAEAGVRDGWDRWIGEAPFVGMTGFGASGPAAALFPHFGITAEAVCDAAMAVLA